MKKQNHSEIAELKYRPLKKNLRVYYKKIKDSLAQESLPDPATLSEFLALSKIMISYPGFGDSYYSNFTKACLTFHKACHKKDFHKVQEAFGLIRQIKHDCHQGR